MGEKGSGKTTLIEYLLSVRTNKYISNAFRKTLILTFQHIGCTVTGSKFNLSLNKKINFFNAFL